MGTRTAEDSIANLIGLGALNKGKGPSLVPNFRVDPDDYPGLATSALELGTDIRVAYVEALGKQERLERVEDSFFLERAKEYVELNEQVETSTGLLTDLASFLSTFQHDLSAVSGHISDLQGRSKTIEARLVARKAVERQLHPLLSSISISPRLIDIIVDTEVNDEWIPAVTELDAKLGAIRSGPRLESRKTLDDVAEALRIKAAQKILAHFLLLLKPFALSIAPSLPRLQATSLLPLKPLFDFLRRHAARQAHEFQKAYVATIRWYYETGFRRYIRGLETIRLRVLERYEPIGSVVAGTESTLALLNKKSFPAGVISNALDHAQLDGPGVVLAYMSADKSFRPSNEALFRSASLVLMDNAETEYDFLATFFGRHSELPVFPRASPALFSSDTSASGSEASTPAPSLRGGTGGLPAGSRRGSVDGESVLGSEWGRLNAADSTLTRDERGEKLRRAVVDGLWKNILEPAQEYVRNFAAALLDPSPPSPVSLLSMIRLNDSIVSSLVTSSVCLPMENHLIGLRMQLWPTFARGMNVEIESLRKINGTLPSGGVFGGKGTGINVKDSVVQIVALRYTGMFNSFVALSEDHDDEQVFSSLLRLRQELDTLLVYQSDKMPDLNKRRAFLSTHYEELLNGLSTGLSRHSRSQAEVAHYKELVRKCSQ